MPESEFGGNPNELGIQPLPHRPTADEQLQVIYQTGDATGGTEGVYLPRDKDVFTGLLPLAERMAQLEAEGAFEKGQIWEEMQ